MPESRLRPPELAPGGRKSRINTTQTRVSNQFQVGNRRNTQGICAGAGYFNKFLEATWAVFEWLRGKKPAIPTA